MDADAGGPLEGPPVLRLEGVTKRFPGGVTANDEVDLEIRAGEIHALLGENGAGKSTLMGVLFGLHVPDAGRILLDGRPVSHRSPAAAIRDGIGMVHQHFKLVPRLSVAQNIFLTAGRRRFLFDAAATRARTRELVQRYGLGIDPDAVVRDLPLAAQQRVEILRALYQDARVLILDEPTTILAPAEVDGLYAILRTLADEGRAVVVITHHLREVVEHSDRVTVLRRGRVVGEGPTSGLDPAAMGRLIVGADLPTLPPRAPTVPGEVVVRLEEVHVAAAPGTSGLDGVSLSVRRGEVLGIAGVEGNGQRELAEAVAGLAAPRAGHVELLGAARDGADRAAFLGAGVALVPEDRHAEGLVLDLDVTDNLLIDSLDDPAYARPGWLRLGAMRAQGRTLVERFRIVTPDERTHVRSLSGGNQQKVVIGRAMKRLPTLVVAHQPTRGLDVSAALEVLDRLVEVSRAGAGVILISSDLDELMATSDRIAVLHRGRIAGVLEGGDATKERLGQLMTGAVAA